MTEGKGLPEVQPGQLPRTRPACVRKSVGAGLESPVIGDNCYIGPGAKIYGKIVIGDNCAIGANAVVNKDFKDGNCTIAGVPAKITSYKTSKGYI